MLWGSTRTICNKRGNRFVRGARPRDQERPCGILNTLGAKNIRDIPAYVTTLQDTGAGNTEAAPAAK
jgi:hypothetical protein